MTPEQIEIASQHILRVRNEVLDKIAEIGHPEVLGQERAATLAIDALVAAAAMAASLSGLTPTARHKRMLADEIRTGFLKSLKVADEEVASVLRPDN